MLISYVLIGFSKIFINLIEGFTWIYLEKNYDMNLGYFKNVYHCSAKEKV